MTALSPQDELKLYEELESGVAPMRELEIYETLEGLGGQNLPQTPAQPVEEDKSFTERVSERHKERVGEVAETFEQRVKGEISEASAILQTVGKGGAGMAMDIMGEGLVSIGQGISYVVPDNVEDAVKSGFSQGMDMLMNTEYGQMAEQALMEGADKWGQFKKENPTAAKNVESAVNIGMFIAPAKVKAGANPVKPSAARKVSKYIGHKTSKQIAQKRGQFVQDLISPVRTKKVLESEVPRTTEVGKGIFKRSKVAPTRRESQIAQEVARVKEVTNKKSVQGNYNVLDKKVSALADDLERQVSKSKAVVPFEEAVKTIDDRLGVIIDESPLIVGNLKTTAQRVGEQAKKIINSNPPTPQGMLKSRKQFDAWVKTLPRGEAKLAADASMEAQSIAIKTVRRTMNDIVDTKAKNATVHRELQRQSKLLEAMDNMVPKAAAEANTAVGRLWQNATSVLPIRNKMIQEAALLSGIGGLGAAAIFAPYITAAAGTVAMGVGASKLVMSPASKKLVSKIIKITDEAIQRSTNKDMIRQLRADRALAVELLENSVVEGEENNEIEEDNVPLGTQ